ncbi:adenylate/guanylate cyclase domain-containing protein [Flammeovirga aprica]|uniref:Adenylate/guanylate cyclase domain-containing protein n=1 Tax=Flammeovirga aprica JL-4 TaxID=694437 RepID=A0A7X9RSW0_9BACT|nr:adenylate/guanylate cyclase domain-containing protein [Flammeovirga aprica]NME66499.1 adenylate/guanylate cyclase domain-containing protein [Flammeovirga aprica JL-4]
MKVTSNIAYDYENSFDRIQEILDSSETFEQVDYVPDSDNLTYSNGYYFKCYSIFIDIRDSSKLPDKFQKRTLAKIYRAYISEIVALFQSSKECKEINIVGDSVWAIFLAEKKEDVKKIFGAAYAANSIVNTLNYKLCRKNIDPIKAGIGVDKGDALMVKAGFKGSGLNDVIYMGGVVNNASKLCSKANKGWINEIVVSKAVYDDLSGYKNSLDKYYQDMLTHNTEENFYHGSIIRMDMNDWLAEQKQKNPCSR